MSEEKKESWLNLLALTTVILAVCATMATFKGGGYSTRSLLRQSQASDRWAHYQSKSIKSNLFEQSSERLQLDMKVLGPKGSQDILSEYQNRLGEYKKEIARYDVEKKTIFGEAKALEKERDDAQKHSQVFGLAVIFLQISILLSSISALLKQKPVYWIGLIVGAVGMVYFLNGFFLFL